MRHFLLLLLVHGFYCQHRVLVMTVILVCGNYRRLTWRFVHASPHNFITNHTEKIHSKLRAHDEIIILGTLLQRIFYIDLIANVTHIPFHLKSTESDISFNSKTNNHWQEEIKLVSNNLAVNTTFIINIIVDADEGFNISLNEQIFLRTQKRQSLDQIKELRIYGNITLKSVRIIQARKEEKSERTLIIGVAISCVLVIIAVLGIFYVLRRQCVDRHEKNDPAQEQDRAVDSLASHMSDTTELSEKTSNTGSSFVP